MDEMRNRRGSKVAFVAACVLVLQSFLSAWAVGAMPVLDAFGNPLCVTSVDHGSTTPNGGHSKLPDCCAFGCSMVSPLLAVATADGTGISQPLPSDHIRFGLGHSFHVDGPDHDPGSPRAPPLTA